MGFLGDLFGGSGGDIIGAIVGAQQADKNRDFQAWHAANAHQVEVKDLKAAGLNPILSAKFGGASTPPGSSFTPDFDNPGVTSAVMAKTRAEEKLASKSTEEADSRIGLNRENSRIASAKAGMDEIELEKQRRHFQEIYGGSVGDKDTGVPENKAASRVEDSPEWVKSIVGNLSQWSGKNVDDNASTIERMIKWYADWKETKRRKKPAKLKEDKQFVPSPTFRDREGNIIFGEKK